MPTALLYTLGAFALILVLARFRVPLAAAILGGTVALGVALGLNAGDLLRAAVAGLTAPMSLALMLITLLLPALSEIMRQTGQMERIVSAARAFFRRPAVTMAALPALIGLLPMPGGALFSAPMVESAAGGKPVGAGKLSAFNYWFRHIWEHWWPLYPGVILAMTLTQTPAWRFIVFQIPLGLFMAVAGAPLFFGLHPDLHARSPHVSSETKRQMLKVTSSIWIIVLAYVLGAVALHLGVGPAPMQLPGQPALTAGQEWLSLAHKFGPFLVGLAASLLWTARMNRMPWSGVGKVFARPGLYALVVLVASVMIFQAVLKAGGAAPKIAAELAALHVPTELVIMALPCIAGLVTGLAFGFVGTSFPIVLPLAAAAANGAPLAPYVALAYAFGHLGQMSSPIHLCHVVSNQYFKTPFGPVYRQIWLPMLLAGVMTLAYFFALRAIL